MEIHIWMTFWGPLTQNEFFVRTVERNQTNDYRCSYQAGLWEFQMYDQGKIILESKLIDRRQNYLFFRKEIYQILWDGEEIAILTKTFFRKKIIFQGKEIYLPGLFSRRLQDLHLDFPLMSLLYRRKVKSICTTKDPRKIMLSIAVTIFVWLTWNALPI